MTWNPRDLQWQDPDTALQTKHPASQAHMPIPDADMLASAAPFIVVDETAPQMLPLPVRRELHDAGLVDDATWMRWRRAMTRGITPF